VLPTIPLLLVGVVVLASAVLTIAASVGPSLRATRVSPVAAMAID
jgi:putative ABC transport system permease protein